MDKKKQHLSDRHSDICGYAFNVFAAQLFVKICFYYIVDANNNASIVGCIIYEAGHDAIA